MSQQLTLRSRKKAKTRQALLDAATELFAERGFEETTLEEICEAAEVSLRTFFRYFESKFDLALDQNYRNAQARKEALKDHPDPLGFLRGFYTNVAKEIRADDHALQRFTLATQPALMAKWLMIDLGSEADITRALARAAGGGRRAELRARLVAAMIVSGTRSAAQRWVASAGKENIVRLVGDVFDLVDEVSGRWLPAAGR